MKGVVGMIVVLGIAVSVQAYSQTMPDQTWKGKISDSNCKEKHPAGEHDGKKMTDADCTTVCVKKGAKFVFVSDGKVYQLANNSRETRRHILLCLPPRPTLATPRLKLIVTVRAVPSA